MKAKIIETGEILEVKKIHNKIIVLWLNKPFNMSINLLVEVCVLELSKVILINTNNQLKLF
jgi:TFIIF-interacting CTD phosphatase-like protein